MKSKFIELTAVNGYTASLNVNHIVRVVDKDGSTAIYTVNHEAGLATNTSYEEVMKLIKAAE